MGHLAEGIEADTRVQDHSDWHLVIRILKYFQSEWKVIILITLMIVLNALLDAAFPILLSRSIDTVVATKALQNVIPLIIGLLVIGLLAWGCNFLYTWYNARVVGNVVLKLRLDAFKSAVNYDMSFYDKHSSGEVISRITSGTEDFATVITLTLGLLGQFLLVFFIIFFLFYRNSLLALITLSIAPIIVIIALSFQKAERYSTQKFQQVLAKFTTLEKEAVDGIAVTKDYRQEETVYKELKRTGRDLYRASLRSGFIYSGLSPILVTLANLGTIAIIYFGGLNVLSHTISIGDWFLFIQGIGLFWFPLTSIAAFWSQFQRGLSASERLFALLDTRTELQQIEQKRVTRLSGRIHFENLSFGYTDQQNVLTNFTLSIEEGETIALVGHTGAGKSTIGKLIARFYEFQSGEILIDDCDIRTFNLSEYSSQLGIIPQVALLFSGTVADNIRYAKPEATDDDVLSVAQQIEEGKWLRSLTDGLNTVVGESGKGISMGQRQLIALCRVLLQNPAIIILDEATASVDPLTEVQIQSCLDLLLKNRTSIVIAHRLSTIQRADRIVVLDGGQIIEEGNHMALMARRGYYAELYNIYYRHQSLDYLPDKDAASKKL